MVTVAPGGWLSTWSVPTAVTGAGVLARARTGAEVTGGAGGRTSCGSPPANLRYTTTPAAMAPTSSRRPTPPRIAARGGRFFGAAARGEASGGVAAAERAAGGRDGVPTGVARRVTSAEPMTTVGPGGSSGDGGLDAGRGAAGRG